MALGFLQILGQAVDSLNATNYSNIINNSEIFNNISTIAYVPPKVFAGAFATMMAIWLIVIVLIVLLLILWIFMIVDVAKRKFKQEQDKIGWILVIVLTGYIGAIVYYFAIKKGDKH